MARQTTSLWRCKAPSARSTDWGLNVLGPTSDFAAIRKLLVERFHHLEDDVPHDDWWLERHLSNDLAELAACLPNSMVWFLIPEPTGEANGA